MLYGNGTRDDVLPAVAWSCPHGWPKNRRARTAQDLARL